MKLIPTLRITAMTAFGLIVACSDSTGPDGSRNALGILQLEVVSSPTSGSQAPPGSITWSLAPGPDMIYPPEVIQAPDTVDLNQSFEVTVRTVGPDGCWMADTMEVERSGRTVEMTPLDRRSGAEVCTMVLSYLMHVTSLTLDQAGEWTLRANGRRVWGNAGPDELVSAERVVYVRPVN